MKTYHYILLLSVLLASCGTLKKYDSKAVSIDCSVIQCPTIAELDVQKNSISGSAEWQEKWFARSIPLSVRKGNLIAELTLQAKADVLVEPRFTFEQGQAGRNSRKLTVTGYPATFKNFRSATPADFELLKSAELSQDIQLTTRYKMKDLKRGITLPKPKTWLLKK